MKGIQMLTVYITTLSFCFVFFVFAFVFCDNGKIGIDVGGGGGGVSIILDKNKFPIGKNICLRKPKSNK
jgi:hypothetical protein